MLAPYHYHPRYVVVRGDGPRNGRWPTVDGMTKEPDYDVVVIGAGGAGLAAAVSAAEAGASVLIIESAGKPGGSTALAGGSFMAAGTSVQMAAGYPDDTADAFYDYYLTFNRWDVEPAVVRRFCDAALPTFEWLQGLGVQYTPEGLYRAGREEAPRSHRPVGGGQAYVDALVKAARSRSVDFAFGQRVDQLDLDPSGNCHRVRAGEEEITGGAVVLATGGFGANPALIRKHLPDADPEKAWSPAAGTCQGDGLALALGAGADTTGINHGDLLVTSGLVKDIEPYPPGWLVIVGRDGRRFVDESAPYGVVTPLALKHGPCWVILDDRLVRSAKADPHSAWGSGTWTTDTLIGAAADGRVPQADSVEELGAAIGVPGTALAGAVRRYNESCAAARDAEFLKPPQNLVAIETPPYYAVRLWPAVVALTGYGPRIDPDARVLSAADGDPIPGLYAAGEVTGNVLGPQYVGGGNAIGSALIFGRIAGRSAAAARKSVAAGVAQ
jgi:fumarate reductase flavoprotein subunit